ncbi:insulinase family protein [Chitinispirillales bacterium ANBcel5]|uniref:insulinase family protein n=1 Tax=Cellulosispirillum alkaliphilum TaxID=3039283 RepID=UPI002A4E92A8|nr:insulinase family protein [Chitinispirillales bacterium ANBcel5]
MSETNLPVQDIELTEEISGFRLDRVEKIPELRSTAYIFTHVKTACRLMHLFNSDPNNLFSVAFRTPVNDSTGVPHILEHSVLCGSKKFPVKDPFQEMLKGSLQTFLNALTYPDKTVYPVSSQVEKDYYNLMDVYCDAVFNPLLSENTFYQEGWHFDVEDIDNPVGIKGIVYNEMKGVFSDFSSHVFRRTMSALYPDTTYAFESGGDPECITDLTYEQFRDFHRKFYHPSNSFIFLYGNIPSKKTLQFLDANYLGSYDHLQIDSTVSPQPLWDKPKSTVIEAPAPKEDDGTATVSVSWIFGDSKDPVTTLTGSILSHYLLGTETSPLKRALVDSGLGEDLDDVTGFDAELIQSSFAVGLRKTKPEHAEKIKELIFETLKTELHSMDKQLLEGALRQVEFSRREVAGGHFPYSLRLAERAYRSWLHGGDPVAHLAFEKPLNYIKEQMKIGNYFEKVIEEKLVNNPHNLLSTIVASSKMGEKLELQTQKQSQKLTANITQDEKEKYNRLTKKLIEQQKSQSSAEQKAKLPKLQKSDLPRHLKEVPVKKEEIEGIKFMAHPLFTSGITYLDIGFDLSVVPADLLYFVPIYLELMNRCGAGEYSYEKMAKRVTLSTGGIDTSAVCRTKISSEQDLLFMAFFHGKSLEARFAEMLQIFTDLLTKPDLSNEKQIRDLLVEERNEMASSVISSGHSFAMTNASSALIRSKYIGEVMGGISQLRFLDELVKNDDINKVIEACTQLHKIIVNKESLLFSLTAQEPEKFSDMLKTFAEKLPQQSIETEPPPEEYGREEGLRGIEISSAVNFVSRAWKLQDKSAHQLANLFLLSRNLSTGYLWDKIRVEGGAYGGMASMSVFHPVFATASYRDPNLESTLQHFENGLQEVADGIEQEKIDQSIIGAIGRMDSPKSPHGQGLGETLDSLSDYSKEIRQTIRDEILQANTDSLKNAAKSILDSQRWSVTALGSAKAFEKAEQSGLKFEREPLVGSK